MEQQNQQRNFFFEHIKNYFEKNNSEDIKHILRSAINSIKNGEMLNENQFEATGIFAFLFGVDYVSMQKPVKTIINRVNERFEALNVDKKLIETFIDFMYLFELKHLDDDVIKYNEKCLNAKIKTFLTVEDYKIFSSIRMQLVSLMKKCIVPVKYAINYNNLMNDDLTYGDLLRINSFFTENTRQTGKTARRIAHLYSNEDFVLFLNDAMTYFNGTKFEILYKESLLSLHESMKNFQLRIDYTDDEFQKFSDEIAELQTKMQQEEKENSENYERVFEKIHHLNQEEFSNYIAENPHQFFLSVLEDVMKRKFIMNSKFIMNAINKFVEDNDFVQNIYPFLGKHSSNKNLPLIKGIENVYNQVANNLFETVEKLKIDYREKAESIFAEIDENKIQRILYLVKQVLDVVYINDAEQKQYVASQLLQNGISTYNHLQQMLSVIESCEILGNDVCKYMELYDYLKNDDIISKVFDDVNETQELVEKIKLYHRLYEWFNIKQSEDN